MRTLRQAGGRVSSGRTAPLITDSCFRKRQGRGTSPAALGHQPATFDTYAYPLLRFAVDGKFKYPYLPWPDDAEARIAKAA